MGITAASLFSGIGAPETAMPGWHWAWNAEVEPFPSAVLKARHPGSVNLGDVTAPDFVERANAIARPDVIVFGSPCQSFSVAGKRLGLDDARGNLAIVALGIVARLKPTWFCFENVPGLLSSAGGSDFGLFLRAVDELGYHLAWTVLDAQYFGVAQRRERVFAVGHIGDWRYPAAVLLEPEGLRGHHPPRRQAGQGVAPTIASRPTGGGGLGTDFDCDGGLITAKSLSARGWSSQREDSDTFVPEVAWALQERDHKGAGGVSGVAIAFDPALCFTAKDYGADAQNDLAPTLRSGGHDKSHANAGVMPAVAFKYGQGAKARSLGLQEEQAPTLSSADSGTQLAPGLLQGMSVRRLTPLECERLQGFPDDYTLVTYRNKPAADGPRYKALGNSMAVPVVRWILERIEVAHLTAERDR